MSVLMPIFSICVTAFAQSPDQTNLALHREYTLSPAPNYYHSRDDGDATQLTDGKTSYGPGMWMNLSTVGWGSGLDEPVMIHFDLGEPATLSELRFNSVGGGGSGVTSVGLTVYVSLDAKSYVIAGEVPPPEQPARGISEGVRLRVGLKNCKARYLAVAALAPKPHYFVMVDEIEIIGKSPADPTSTLPVRAVVCASGASGVHFWNMLYNSTSGWIDESLGVVYWPMVYVTVDERFSPPADLDTAECVIPSRRWEYVRMGIEDYMLLRMAADQIDHHRDTTDRNQLDAIIEEVLRNRSSDRSSFRQSRRKLLELVARVANRN